MAYHVRIARPVTDLARSEALYCAGLGLCVVDRFENHEGFDGVMLAPANADAGYHFELTRHRDHPIRPTPTVEDLVIFYVPDLREWEAACARLSSCGFERVASFNPYWERRGRTYEDFDGYRIVLENAKFDQ